MSWRYSDLSEEEKEKIGFELPENLLFEGEPGDQIMPVVTCPFCGDEFTSYDPACEHLAYYYHWEDQCYTEISEILLQKSKEIIRKKFEWPEFEFEKEFSSPPWRIVEKDSEEIGFEDLFPNITEIEISISFGHAGWNETVGFYRS